MQTKTRGTDSTLNDGGWLPTIDRDSRIAGQPGNSIKFVIKLWKSATAIGNRTQSHIKEPFRQSASQPREICMPRFRVERRVYHYAKRWSFCIRKQQRRSVPYIHASISMQQYQCLAIRRSSGQLTHCTTLHCTALHWSTARHNSIISAFRYVGRRSWPDL